MKVQVKTFIYRECRRGNWKVQVLFEPEDIEGCEYTYDFSRSMSEKEVRKAIERRKSVILKKAIKEGKF